MDLKIIEEHHNPLLNRKEINGEILHLSDSTPNREAVRARAAALLNADLDRVILVSIKSEFGRGVSRVKLHVYQNPEAVRIEPLYILKRNGLVEAEE